ncbi:MAG TPA: alkaline phosphatase D family protein [Dehalococcoidia bacterium]
MVRLSIFAAIALALVGAAFGAGFAVDRATDDSSARVETPEAGPVVAVSLNVDDAYEGRLLITRTDCSGDGSVVAAFLWSRPANGQADSYRIAVAPIEFEGDFSHLPDAVVRDSPRGQAKIGGLQPAREYAARVARTGQSDVWARSTFTTPSCDSFASVCTPSSDLLSEGPVSGTTTDTTARIWVRSCYPVPVAIQFRPTGSAATTLVTTLPQDTAADADNTAVFQLTGLQPSTSYDYTVLVAGLAVDQPRAHFWTMPTTGSPTKLRFITGSDLHQFTTQNRPQPRLTLTQMLGADPHFALLIGDQIDVDGFGKFNPASPEAYLRHYRDNWSLPQFRALLAGVSTRMMWDDHDILNDWDKNELAPYPFARAAFNDFVARQNPDPVQPGSTYFTFDAGDISFFVLDCRSFRDKKNAPDDASKSMLGDQQKADLKHWLTTSNAKFKFIASTVQWSDYQVRPLRTNDAWDGFRTERQEIFDFIHNNHVGGVALLSGDAHWPAVISHPYGLIEFQTTPAGVSPPAAPVEVHGAPDVLFYADQKNVFGRFDVDTTVTPARLDFAMVDATGQLLFTKTVTSDDLAQ